jgi:hypothetical protein
MENNCIIEDMEIKFVGWLSPKTIQNKKASSLIVEFTKPEHANRAIDEVASLRDYMAEAYVRRKRTQAEYSVMLQVRTKDYAFLSSSALFVLRNAVVDDFGWERKDLAASPPPLYTISAAVRSSKELTVRSLGDFMLFSI